MDYYGDDDYETVADTFPTPGPGYDHTAMIAAQKDTQRRYQRQQIFATLYRDGISFDDAVNQSKRLMSFIETGE